MEKRTKFIINFLYFAIIIALAFFVLRFALSFLFPFVAALFIAYILRRPIQFITTRMADSFPGSCQPFLWFWYFM